MHDFPETDPQFACECTMREIGENTSEELYVVPAQVCVIQHIK